MRKMSDKKPIISVYIANRSFALCAVIYHMIMTLFKVINHLAADAYPID